MLSALSDQYTVLIEPPATRLETDQLRGQFGGIGADLRRDAEGRTHLTPYPDGPAAKAGAIIDDELAAVDGDPIVPTMRLDEIEARLRGDVGSHVRLTLIRGDRTIEIDVERASITPPSTQWRIIAEAPNLGYISIRIFTDRTSDEVKRAIEELRGRGARALILDVRDNGGGLLDSAVSVTGQFVEGVVMFEQRREGGERQLSAPAGGAGTDLPLVVLVNNSTASASEIVAGALHDRGRAILIGERTYGKGSVQSIYPLADGSSLHITTAEWYTPNHGKLSGEGLAPDIQAVLTADDRAAGRDPVLDRAIAYLSVELP